MSTAIDGPAEDVPDPFEAPVSLSADDLAAGSVVDRTMAALRAHRAEHGTVPNRMLAQAAGRCGRSVRTLRRWLAAEETDATGPFVIGDLHLEAIAGHNGNVAKAHADLVDSGAEVPSYATFWRAWRTQPAGLRAYISDGADAMKAKWIYAPYTAPSRNAVWQADHFELPVDVIPDGYETTTCKPWLTMFQDDKTRMIMSWAIVAVPGRRPDAPMVAACIAAAISPHQVAGVDVGGVPGSIRWDQALEFKAGMVTQLALRVGFDAHGVPPYSGHMKGKIERAGRTAQEEVAALCTGYTHGANTLSNKTPFRDEPITERLLIARFNEWVEHYNTTRPHSGLGGRTPLEAWKADTTPLRLVHHDLLRDSFLVAPRLRKVGKKGVFFAKQWWLGPDLLDHVDRKVEVRYPIGDDSFIEIHLDGQWMCTAEPAETLSPEARRALQVNRNNQYAEARRIQDGARRRRSAANQTSTIDRPALPPLSAMDDDGLDAEPADLFDLLPDEDDEDA